MTFIDSVDNEQQAIELSMQVKAIHSAAGFYIRNWSSNSQKVVNYLNNEYTANQTSKDLTNTEKVLGMFWDSRKDSFVYVFRFARLRRDVLKEDVIPTKREVLQVLMSILDPMGFLSTTLKILLQEVWRSGIDWDEQRRDAMHLKWKKWKTAIEHITSVEIPRCYSAYLNEATEVELHTFVDAGEDAFAAVCYIRTVYQSNCSDLIVAGKSKVAPLKPMSIGTPSSYNGCKASQQNR